MWKFVTALMGLPMAAFAQVDQGPPNADFAPAFEGQTRAPALADSEFAVEVFASGFDFAWGIAPLPDGRFIVSERGGDLQLVGADGTRIGAIENVPDVTAIRQGGMLDVAVAHDFATSGVIYWTYAKPMDGGTALAAGRGVLSNGALADVEDIFIQTPVVNSTKHFGSRIVMGDGGLWITAGDRGAESLVQDPASTVGKVIWIDDAGTGTIWSSGHRNVQGAIVRDGELWAVEHGPRGGDELNRVEQGLNYGWPIVSYGIDYSGRDVGEGIASDDDYQQPIYYWDPVIAPGGMGTYPVDAAFEPWRGDMFVASLNPGGLMRLKIEGGRVIGEERLLADVGRVRDVEVLVNGDLLVLLDAPDGDILRITPVQ